MESCRSCPRLVEWREEVADVKRASFAGDSYWGKPVPGFGDSCASLVVVGLAPAAHGANRTGRMFTGDRSGDWLYRALHRAGFANTDISYSRDDELRLNDCYVTSVVKCAPPANRPTPTERDMCLPYLIRELDAIHPRVVVALGSFAWQGVFRAMLAGGWAVPPPRPKFAHLAKATLARGSKCVAVVGSYHPSQQNTFTGRLTVEMFDAVFEMARAAITRS